MPSAADKLVDRVVGWTTADSLAVINRGAGACVLHTKIEITGDSHEDVLARANEVLAQLEVDGITVSRYTYLIYHHRVE
jgi:hypothetical protein